MVQDATTALRWCKHNIHKYGGDASNITLVGQSAGAWLAMMTTLEMAADEAGGSASETPFEQATLSEGAAALRPLCCADLRRVVGISGPYDMADRQQLDHFHQRGLYKTVLYGILEGELSRWSPTRVVKAMGDRALTNLPPVFLVHGTADQTVPVASTHDLVAALAQRGIKAETVVLEGKSHTDGIIEDVFQEGDNTTMMELLRVVYGHSGGHPGAQKYAYPSALMRLARIANPF